MVSVYRPCEPSGRPGPGTVFEQHRRFFGENNRDPRQALLDDLRDAILTWQEAGDIIVLGNGWERRHPVSQPPTVFLGFEHEERNLGYA